MFRRSFAPGEVWEFTKMNDKREKIQQLLDESLALTPSTTPCNKEIKRLKGVIKVMIDRIKTQEHSFSQLKKENLLLRESLEIIQISCSKSLNASEAMFEKMNEDIENGVAMKRKKG